MWPGVGVAERQRDGPTEQFEQSSQTSRFKEGWMMMCGLQKDLGRGGGSGWIEKLFLDGGLDKAGSTRGKADPCRAKGTDGCGEKKMDLC